MQPNERVARLVAAILLTGLVAGPLAGPAKADGHAATTTDLQITSLTVSSPRYLVRTEVVVVIENKGGLTFADGWQVFVGWNGDGDANCINPASSGTTSLNVGQDIETGRPGCYARYAPGERVLARNQPVEIRFEWTPRSNHRGDGTLFARIDGIGTTPTAGNAPTGPDGVPANNVRNVAVTVHAPAVVAVPDRDPRPGVSDRNALWGWEHVASDCAPLPTVNRVGCRALPNASYRFAFRLQNLGTMGDSFTGSIVPGSAADAEKLARRGYDFTFVPKTVYVPRGDQATVHVDVFVPPHEIHNEGINVNESGPNLGPRVNVRWTSSLNAAVHTGSEEHCPGGYTCQDPTMASVWALIRRGMNATTNETIKAVNAGDTTTFNVRVENAGNWDDNFTAVLLADRSAINDSWRPRITSTGVLAPGQAKNVTIDVTAPDRIPKDFYRFEVRVFSQGDATGAAVATFPFTVDLRQRFGLLTSLLPSSTQVAPGEKVTYALTVTNTGNGHDNVTVTAQGAPGGWDASLSEPMLPLPPFGSRTTLLNLTAPPGTPAGQQANVKLNAISQGTNGPLGSPLEKAPELTATLTVLARPNVDVQLEGPPRRYVDPGRSTDYDLTVRNTGNQASNFTISVAPSDTAWAAVATPPHVVLNPLESAVVRVSLRAPGDAAVGETVRAIATVRSVTVQEQFRQTTLTGLVSGPDLALRGLSPNASHPYSGDPLALDVTLANEGNKPPGTNATLRVLFIQNGVERLVAERDYAAPDLPGGRRISERFEWDTSGVEGSGILVARIDPANRIAEIDDSAQSNELSVPVTLRTFDVTVQAPQDQSGRPGERVSYGERPNVFVLRYRGNQPAEPVRVHVQSENGWVDAERASLSLDLPRGAEVPVPVEVLIPLAPGVSADKLTLVVVPVYRPDHPVSASATTRVVDEERPVIVRVEAKPPRARIGENVTLEATVRDATGVSAVKLHLVSPSNDTTALAMAHVGGDTWALSQTFHAAGTYRVFVEAVDRAEPPNSAVSRNNLVELFIDPGSAPTIRLADNQTTTVRTGTPVRLNITDPLGVARAAYVIRGIAYDMPRPFQIDTSSFPAGNVEVLVEAANVYGVKSTARFNLTIDNTPPGIREVKLDPENPSVNEDAVLTILTDAKVTGVDVRIRKDGQVVETRSATRKGPGLFELTLNPGEGDYVLDVTATDEAGNVQLQEGAAKFSAKPKSPFDVPGPGAALVLLGMAAVALALGRRRAR